MTDQNDATSPKPAPPATSPDTGDAPEAQNPVAALLKAPHQVADLIANERKGLAGTALAMLAAGVVCHAVFGMATGLFAGWRVAAMDAVKAPLVAFCALLVSFPSLYVFTCVAGSPLSLSQTLALGCSCLAMVGFLLVGLAPVSWLFAVSTENLPFIVVLTVLVWLIAVLFAARYVARLKTTPLFRRQAGIRMWFVILILVTLQMATCMRPMLTSPERGWWTSRKAFFLAHFGSTFEEGEKATDPRNGARAPQR